MRKFSRTLRSVSWLLCVSIGVLTGWNRKFDQELRALPQDDQRGKTFKVNTQVVRQVVEIAQEAQKREKVLRVQNVTELLIQRYGLNLCRQTVQEILIANDFLQVRTRSMRPRYYQSLCQRIPNGLFACDGGEMKVNLGCKKLKYNLELGLDVGTFCHTAFAITPTENADAVVDVLEQHRRKWGNPLGAVFDHGTANLSEAVTTYLDRHGIDAVPAGPANPKGNGSGETAIGQLKEALGEICIDMTDEDSIAHSVLTMLVGLYVRMRNKLALRNPRPTPFEQMQTSASEHERSLEKQRLKAHKKSREKTDKNIKKVDRIHWIIKFHGLNPEPAALKRAEQTIQCYDITAIAEAEKFFLKAINRQSDRCNLPYFFGILRNVEQDLDDQRYRDYCRKKYEYNQLLENERKEQKRKNDEPSVEGLVGLAWSVLNIKFQSIKQYAVQRCKTRLKELLNNKKYVGPVWKKFQDTIGAQKNLDLKQKEKLATFIDELFKQTAGGSGLAGLSQI